jgi:hypothetical protein
VLSGCLIIRHRRRRRLWRHIPVAVGVWGGRWGNVEDEGRLAGWVLGGGVGSGPRSRGDLFVSV